MDVPVTDPPEVPVELAKLSAAVGQWAEVSHRLGNPRVDAATRLLHGALGVLLKELGPPRVRRAQTSQRGPDSP